MACASRRSGPASSTTESALAAEAAHRGLDAQKRRANGEPWNSGPQTRPRATTFQTLAGEVLEIAEGGPSERPRLQTEPGQRRARVHPMRPGDLGSQPGPDPRPTRLPGRIESTPAT